MNSTQLFLQFPELLVFSQTEYGPVLLVFPLKDQIVLILSIWRTLNDFIVLLSFVWLDKIVKIENKDE